jgi:ribonuclease VapC
VKVTPVTLDQAEIAREAYREYGKGNHPAGLNFGDCFSYALAILTQEELLFKGDDFTETDLNTL